MVDRQHQSHAKPAKPNAAARADVDDARRRVEELGLDWHETVQKILSRNTAYTLLRGEGSVGSLRKIEDWLVTKEAERAIERPKGKANTIAEWAAIGEQLHELDADKFEKVLDGLRDVLRATKIEQGGILKMFRPNPDRSR